MSEKHATLVILAAGMSRRYGRLKQFEELGPYGERMMDYTIYDAIEAGFDKIVFVIRRGFEDEFVKEYINRYKDDNLGVKFTYVFQDMSDVPDLSNYKNNGIDISKRTKPLGTAHALYCARHELEEGIGFAVVGCDDFFGFEAIKNLYDFCINFGNVNIAAMIKYKLTTTLGNSANGVSRGICRFDKFGMLENIKECKKVRWINTGTLDLSIAYVRGTRQFTIDKNTAIETVVSMNAWAFSYDIIKYLERFLKRWIAIETNNDRETCISDFVQFMIRTKNYQIKGIDLDEPNCWFGITSLEDRDNVVATLNSYRMRSRYDRIRYLWEK